MDGMCRRAATVQALRGFMSQSADRCLLCVAECQEATSHTNEPPDKTELGGNRPFGAAGERGKKGRVERLKDEEGKMTSQEKKEKEG